MSTVTLNRGTAVKISFTITDDNNGLAGKRVTWAVARVDNGVRVLKKASGLAVSSSEVTIYSQTAGTIIGVVNVLAADFDNMPLGAYMASLWVDDGVSDDICVTPGGFDTLVINRTAPRRP